MEQLSLEDLQRLLDDPNLEADIRRYGEDMRWAFDHHDELLKLYPDQWIFVINKEVIASGPNLRELIAHSQAKGIDTGKVFSCLMETNPRPLILEQS